MTPAFSLLGAAAWTTWVAGPLSMALQLVACLALAVVVSRHRHRPILSWLFVGCAAAALPIAGLLAMAAATLAVRPPRASA